MLFPMEVVVVLLLALCGIYSVLLYGYFFRQAAC